MKKSILIAAAMAVCSFSAQAVTLTNEDVAKISTNAELVDNANSIACTSTDFPGAALSMSYVSPEVAQEVATHFNTHPEEGFTCKAGKSLK